MKLYKFLEINFIDATYEEIIKKLDNGGLLVVPAAPALATIDSNPKYFNALKKSDFAIFDSGFLCLVLRITKMIKVKKMSGLEFIRKFILNVKKNVDNEVFLVEPSEHEAILNKTYFEKNNINIKNNQHIAPMYGDKIIDTALIETLSVSQPKFVIINLGGGVQEVLGLYIKNHFEDKSYKPIIICTGAAVAFLTGSQARIPSFVDKIYLGWLARCFSNPRVFIPRYLSGFKLFRLIINNKVERVL